MSKYARALPAKHVHVDDDHGRGPSTQERIVLAAFLLYLNPTRRSRQYDDALYRAHVCLHPACEYLNSEIQAD